MLLLLLGCLHRAAVSVGDEALTFFCEGPPQASLPLGVHCPAPHQQLTVPTAGLSVRPEHIAAEYCRSLASSGGWAAVQGETLMVQDSADRLAAFRDLARQYLD